MYPTNLTDSQYEIIKEFVDVNRKRKYSLKSIISAVLYICRTGAVSSNFTVPLFRKQKVSV